MNKNKYNLDNFKKNGFFVIKKLLTKKEIKEMEKSFKKKENDSGYNEINDRNCRNYLTNKNLNIKLKAVLGDKIFYLHDLNLAVNQITGKSYTWHRDSPCRKTGHGDDWYPKNSYNVLTTITYLNSSNETATTLNVIPKSNLNTYKNTISNILRFLHSKFRYTKITFLRNLIERINGIDINFEKGDCVVFYANLYHMGHIKSLNIKKDRKLIVCRFGGEGKHTENYINYVLKHREENKNKYKNIPNDNKSDFFKYLSKNNIYFPIPKKKKIIHGVFSNLKSI